MNVRCTEHWGHQAIGICADCGDRVCAQCVVEPTRPLGRRLCIQCALIAGGIRPRRARRPKVPIG